MLLRILGGLILGLMWEWGAVNYTRSVVERKRFLGSAITLGMGLANLLVITVLSWDKKIDMAMAFLAGETIGTYFFIGKKNG